jgi:general stress protein 26
MAIHRLLPPVSRRLEPLSNKGERPEQMPAPMLVWDTPAGDPAMTMTLPELAKKMQKIDFCMMLTKSEFGAIASRPMSNNGDVEYDGDNWYFTQEDARTVGEIERDPRVSLAFQGKHHFYATVEGEAELVRDKAAFEEHWNKDLEMWFKDGVDTPGLVLIKVHAKRIKYCDGMKGEGELVI